MFTIESPNAGTIDNATISLNGKGKKLKWDLKYIEIIDPKVQEGLSGMPCCG